MAKIRPRARLLATIGDQLISGPEAAIIELVKNAYDADATQVLITIAPPNNMSGGQIRCKDDGHGMSVEDISSKWFEPATPDKESRRKSPNGRSMLGSKGVGRFAASKLGDKLTLRSVTRTKSGELKAAKIHVDWAELSKYTYLDEIDIAVKSSTVNQGERTGVTLTIEDLRESWTKPKLERLISELRRLTPPDDHSRAFEVHLNLEQVKGRFDAQALVTGIPTAEDDRPIEQRTLIVPPHDFEKVYHYRLIGNFDNAGRFTGEFHNSRAGTKPKPVSFQGEAETEEAAGCGALSVELSVFDREQAAIDQLCTQSELKIKPIEMRKLLNDNVGVSIFRSGFRIRPYGDSDYDWLELDKRRVQKPTGRIGHNQITGKVIIQGAEKSSLIERTSREGLEHNNAYRRVRVLVLNALLEVENRRELYRQRAGLSRKPNPDIKNIRDNARLHRTHSVITKLPREYQEKIQKALLKDQKGLKTAIDELEAYNQLLASRATLGLVVSQLLHEGERFLGHIRSRTGMVKTRLDNWLKKKIIDEVMHSLVGADADLAVAGVKDLSVLFDSIRPIAARRKEKLKLVNLAFVIQSALNLVADKKGNAELAIELSDASLSVYVLESCLLAAIVNLLDNALYWANQGSAPKVKITASVTKQFVRLNISNNGPQIEESAIERLFDPGYSTKPDGTGLGLAIARESMRICKGDVNIDIEAKGTTFVIEMKMQKGD